jgi:hypothetical protein
MKLKRFGQLNEDQSNLSDLDFSDIKIKPLADREYLSKELPSTDIVVVVTGTEDYVLNFNTEDFKIDRYEGLGAFKKSLGLSEDDFHSMYQLNDKMSGQLDDLEEEIRKKIIKDQFGRYEVEIEELYVGDM